MPDDSSLLELITRLNGKKPSLESDAPQRAEDLMPSPGLGYSQFNEVLLQLGYDRISSSFFQYLLDGTPDYKPGSAFTSLEDIEKGVERFRKQAMWFYGNIRFALQRMSDEDSMELEDLLSRIRPLDEHEFHSRHEPVEQITTVEPESTYLLGYVVEGEIKDALKKDPDDPTWNSLKHRMNEARKKGAKNHELYLTWDHMDVYVATSMRERHQFYSVSRTARSIFENRSLKKLKLRYFDPTQAYCKSRLDKGLAEALMLKRAFCTVYLVQEADSFGKDSELASTLAQGKVVIAYVPRLDDKDEFIREMKEMHDAVYKDREWIEVAKDLLASFDPKIAWTDASVRQWLDDPGRLRIEEVEEKLFETAKCVYDKRADLLLKVHPLGLQVNLETGVANGVLLARTHDECAKLVHDTILHHLDFSIDNDDGTLLLREKATNSVARVVTGDELLTNAFWNFYPA